MCTLIWAPAHRGRGYDLWFNRDERLERAPERPPEHRRETGLAYLAPTDGEAGGTWLAVNEGGLTLCLLNGYGPLSREWGERSRGLFLRDLAGVGDPAQLLAQVGESDLGPYAPFELFAIAPRGRSLLLHWDGERLTPVWDPPRLQSSSGHEPRAIPLARAARYRQLLEEHGREDPGLFERFLSDHGGVAGPASPCMHAARAGTRSQCRVRVRAEGVELVHLPGPPCRTIPSPPHRIPLRLPRSADV